MRPELALALAAAGSVLVVIRIINQPQANDLFQTEHHAPLDTTWSILVQALPWAQVLHFFQLFSRAQILTPFWAYFVVVQVVLIVVGVKYLYSSRCRCPLCTPPFRPKFRVVKMLGTGSFARVLLVSRQVGAQHGHKTHHRNPAVFLPFAVKQAVVDDVTECNEGMFEMELLLRAEHPSLVKVEEQFFHKERTFWKTTLYYCIVMEYCGGGDLFDLIDRAIKYHGGITEKDCLELFTQVLEGIEYMHSKNIIHRDLKPDNILVASTGDLKIADLGLGEKLRTKVVKGGYAGTEGYVAPEVWQGQAYGKACDVWSLGVLLFTMMSWLDIMEIFREEGLAQPTDNDCIEVILRNPEAIDLLLQKIQGSPVVAGLVRRMLVIKPRLRPTCTQLLQLPELKRYRRAPRNRRNSKTPRGSVDLWDGATTPPAPDIPRAQSSADAPAPSTPLWPDAVAAETGRRSGGSSGRVSSGSKEPRGSKQSRSQGSKKSDGASRDEGGTDTKGKRTQRQGRK